MDENSQCTLHFKSHVDSPHTPIQGGILEEVGIMKPSDAGYAHLKICNVRYLSIYGFSSVASRTAVTRGEEGQETKELRKSTVALNPRSRLAESQVEN